MDKDEIRKLALEKRNSLGKVDALEKSLAIQERLLSLPEFRKASAVMFYVSIGNEVRTDTLMECAFKEGKKVIVPFSDRRNKTIVPSEISSLNDMETGSFGIPEPREPKPFNEAGIDLVIVPGIAFDSRGSRIGYGHGYYDNFLKTAGAKKVALAYEFQIVDEIPNNSNDIKMDKIITEKRVIEDD